MVNQVKNIQSTFKIVRNLLTRKYIFPDYLIKLIGMEIDNSEKDEIIGVKNLIDLFCALFSNRFWLTSKHKDIFILSNFI